MKCGWNKKLHVYSVTMILVLMGLINIVSICPAEETEESTRALIQQETLALHAPIRINSDSEFTSANGVNHGSGSVTNPYIIDNWNINGSGYGCGIFIGNTTKHFIIRNCTIDNTSGKPSTPFYYNSGVYINNTNNTYYKFKIV